MRVNMHRITRPQLLALPGVREGLRRTGQAILADSREYIVEMDAIDSTNMIKSGEVVDHEDGVRVQYVNAAIPKKGTIYFAIVHDGTGVGRNSVPRPYLTKAAMQYRGRV